MHATVSCFCCLCYAPKLVPALLISLSDLLCALDLLKEGHVTWAQILPIHCVLLKQCFLYMKIVTVCAHRTLAYRGALKFMQHEDQFELQGEPFLHWWQRKYWTTVAVWDTRRWISSLHSLVVPCCHSRNNNEAPGCWARSIVPVKRCSSKHRDINISMS